MGILNVSFYLKFRNNGSALISVLILLGFVSSLLAILLNVGKQDQEQIGQYQKNNIIYTHIHAVEDFAINILNIDFQNSPNFSFEVNGIAPKSTPNAFKSLSNIIKFYR